MNASLKSVSGPAARSSGQASSRLSSGQGVVAIEGVLELPGAMSLYHGGKLSDAYWNPPPVNHRVVWTVRNEDFYVLRWGAPDFIREFIANNGAPHVGGVLVGSECYIPAKDYITLEGKHKTWTWAFERQWLWYALWGRLLYNPY